MNINDIEGTGERTPSDNDGCGIVIVALIVSFILIVLYARYGTP